MSIYLVCPNGHALKIKDKYAGKSRRCPACKVVIKVPSSSDVIYKDEAELPDESGLSGLDLLSGWNDSQADFQQAEQETQFCAKCCKEIARESKVCPHCGTYVESLTR